MFECEQTLTFIFDGYGMTLEVTVNNVTEAGFNRNHDISYTFLRDLTGNETLSSIYHFTLVYSQDASSVQFGENVRDKKLYKRQVSKT